MTDHSDLKLAVEMLSGGKNTVLLDKFGLPSVMVVIPKMTYKDVGVGDDQPLPAFILNGETKNYFCIGKYQDSLINGVPCSLPMRDPAGNMNFDTALKQIRDKGEGWCLTTNAMYAAIALWCRQNGFMPRGNNNFGCDFTNAWEKGIPASNAKTLTGSGPVGWNHNNDSTGICDLNGNIREFCAGLRLNNGWINIIPDNGAALADADHSAGSTLWKGIRADGELTDPNAADAVKLDWKGSKLICTTAAQEGAADESRSVGFKQLGADEGLMQSMPQIMYGLGLYPKDPDGDYGGDWLTAKLTGEYLACRGGRHSDKNGAGVFNVMFDPLRTSVNAYLGHRCAYVRQLP